MSENKIDLTLLKLFLQNSIDKFSDENIFEINTDEQHPYVIDLLYFNEKNGYKKEAVLNEIRTFKIFSLAVISNEILNKKGFKIMSVYMNYQKILSKELSRDEQNDYMDYRGNFILRRICSNNGSYRLNLYQRKEKFI